eukprot:4462806-Pyramimonas_sp.AAC.1
MAWALASLAAQKIVQAPTATLPGRTGAAAESNGAPPFRHSSFVRSRVRQVRSALLTSPCGRYTG